MTRTLSIFLAALSLGLPGAAAAQNSAAPGNVVTPAPPPREGTVGPEQLRDFALPGTRQATPPPAEAPAPAPAPTTRAAPPAATSRPTPSAPESQPSTRQAADQSTQSAPDAPQPAPESSAATSTAVSVPPPPITLPVPQASAPAPLPPISVTQSGTEAASPLATWWPWLLVAVLGGIGLALLRQRRRQTVAVGPDLERAAPEPAAPVLDRAPPPSEPPQAAPLPTGLVTTRLRSATPPPPASTPPVIPSPVVGGVVSSRLRGWIEIDLSLREILFDADQALLRFDLIVANTGTGIARDIALEAVATNAGEQQGAELAAFFNRPATSTVAIPELAPLQDRVISHELRLPRSAIFAYEAQGRTLFVPVIALNAAYRTSAGEGRTGAAFLIGRDLPGSDKLAPLLLPTGPGRQLGLGVRRLDEAIRR